MSDRMKKASDALHDAIQEIGDHDVAVGGFVALARHGVGEEILSAHLDITHVHDLVFTYEKDVVDWLELSTRFSRLSHEDTRRKYGEDFSKLDKTIPLVDELTKLLFIASFSMPNPTPGENGAHLASNSRYAFDSLARSIFFNPLHPGGVLELHEIVSLAILSLGATEYPQLASVEEKLLYSLGQHPTMDEKLAKAILLPAVIAIAHNESILDDVESRCVRLAQRLGSSEVGIRLFDDMDTAVDNNSRRSLTGESGLQFGDDDLQKAYSKLAIFLSKRFTIPQLSDGQGPEL